MKDNHFCVENSTSFLDVPKGGRVHIIGVCGVAMAPLAVALAKQGYRVSGSDRKFYDPMGSLLRNSDVELFEGYAESHVPDTADLVVFANGMFSDNPEVQFVQKKGLSYTSFPQLVGEAVVGDRHSIVSCGTHGKTTTSAMIATVLHHLGEDPSHFIGGIAPGLPGSLHVGSGRYAVIEGDEYHTAFYSRVPKFRYYRNQTILLNAIEYDHADLYPTIEDVIAEFSWLLSNVPNDGLALCCLDYPHIHSLLENLRASLDCRVLTFGRNKDSDYCLLSRETHGMGQLVRVLTPINGEIVLEVPVPGEYNALNAVATLAALVENGFSPREVAMGLRGFRTVDRRQQVLYNDGITLIEDFAHHPTAVAGTVKAMVEAFPGRKLWAIFEPRSNTSRRKIFEDQYFEAFKGADQVMLAVVEGDSRMDGGVELLDVRQLAKRMNEAGQSTRAFPTARAIENTLLAELGPTDVVLIMSNGAFDGLPARVEAALQHRCAA